MEVVVTTEAIGRTVKSSSPTNQHPTFYRPEKNRECDRKEQKLHRCTAIHWQGCIYVGQGIWPSLLTVRRVRSSPSSTSRTWSISTFSAASCRRFWPCSPCTATSTPLYAAILPALLPWCHLHPRPSLSWQPFSSRTPLSAKRMQQLVRAAWRWLFRHHAEVEQYQL